MSRSREAGRFRAIIPHAESLTLRVDIGGGAMELVTGDHHDPFIAARTARVLM